MYASFVQRSECILTALIGPFELVKNLTQNSETPNTSGKHDPVKASYANKGSIKTAMNIVKHRGYLGLWSGFRLHLRKLINDSVTSNLFSS